MNDSPSYSETHDPPERLQLAPTAYRRQRLIDEHLAARVTAVAIGVDPMHKEVPGVARPVFRHGRKQCQQLRQGRIPARGNRRLRRCRHRRRCGDRPARAGVGVSAGDVVAGCVPDGSGEAVRVAVGAAGDAEAAGEGRCVGRGGLDRGYWRRSWSVARRGLWVRDCDNNNGKHHHSDDELTCLGRPTEFPPHDSP